MKWTPQPGQLVKYTAAFLRNTGQYTNVPIDGKITEATSDLGPDFIKVMWCDAEEPILVNINNVMPAGEPDRS